MPRSLRRQLLLILVAVVVTATACGGDVLPPVASPSSGGVTDTFTGTLTLNGVASFPFVSSTGGVISATLITFTPDTTLQLGLWLGVWDGARCAFGVANDKASQFSSVSGFAAAAGTWCVRIYDAMGTIPQTETYQIDVTHP